MHVRFSDLSRDNYKVQRIRSNESPPRVENSIISRTYSDDSVAVYQAGINDRVKNFTSRKAMNFHCSFTDPDLSKEKFERKRKKIIALFEANGKRQQPHIGQSLLPTKNVPNESYSYTILSQEEINLIKMEYYATVSDPQISNIDSSKKKKKRKKILTNSFLKLEDSLLNTSFHDHEIYKSIPSKSFQFPEDAIIRSFIPDQVILPEAIFINNIPFNLNNFAADRVHEDLVLDFFYTLLRDFKLPHYNDETLKLAVSDLYKNKNIFPLDLKNVLAISTISSRLLAYELLDKVFPKIRDQFIYRSAGKVKIFYDVNENQISCRQPITIMIYPKIEPNEPTCHVKDDKRPLALATFIWRSYLKGGHYAFNLLQFHDLNFIYEEKALNATSSEKRAIKNALKAKQPITSPITSPRILNKIKV